MKRVECNPQPHRFFNGTMKRTGTQKSDGIKIMCGRNFLPEPFVYKFKEGEEEKDHSYPNNDKQAEVPFEDQVIFPPPKKRWNNYNF